MQVITDVTEMDTSSVSPHEDTNSNNSFSLSGEDEFDSIVGTIDVNEATIVNSQRKADGAVQLREEFSDHV